MSQDTKYVSSNFTKTAQGVELANKNPHAVALGKMSSPAKAKAAASNGEKGGRPKGS